MRMNDTVETANSKVLVNPTQSPAIVAANDRVSAGVHDFHGPLGVEAADHEDSEAVAWRDAASEQLDRARDLGAGGLDVAKNIGGEPRDRAKAVAGKLSGLAGRKLRCGRGGEGDDDG